MARAARALAETQTWKRFKEDFARAIEGPYESEMPWLKRNG